MQKIRKLFGELELTWPRLLVFAVLAGLYTGLMALLPMAKDTSFADISISFECWVLFGVLILMNSRSPLDAGCKCFVFFLVSQPLVYLVQVPFSALGWQIFGYDRNWIGWTLLTFPMGFIGHYLKQGKWWGLLILGPVLAFLGYHFAHYLAQLLAWPPHHLLTVLFCAGTMLLYPAAIFQDKKIRAAGLLLAAAILLVGGYLGIKADHSFYNTTILVSAEDPAAPDYFDERYAVRLEDESFGEVSIYYEQGLDCYAVRAEFKKPGSTRLILTAPDGSALAWPITVGKDTYDRGEPVPWEDQGA